MKQIASWDLATVEATQELGEKLAKVLFPGDVLALEGELGAGKTTFAQGVARGLGITETIDSPTFTIVKEYPSKLPLYHLDLYRLQTSEEALDFEEYFYGDGICLIEWATRAKDWLPEETFWLHFSVGEEGSRHLTLTYKE
ncbi:tRNA threonylcarbamoyladenosine biosynthesis protein TsaE [Seinonella peptonophila]|uniref:tRNA threonylcarbamoyladenosine biosynthesis protein TsaE n=1 Tax=Seinonella peptonophila TaxID=112248 RepID=A0A1M4Y3I7_9BACL|nr:tRNA (adenosine(37)-N6)-threonylcarbamoyltransferase complex ATPase subunit type 1 TsaE [Seinonella peptonophila]SHF00387.1 tRNA threonylcarbamoyladenosine biosynthesis protein TsaE [Seinonella peptonophila]